MLGWILTRSIQIPSRLYTLRFAKDLERILQSGVNDPKRAATEMKSRIAEVTADAPLKRVYTTLAALDKNCARRNGFSVAVLWNEVEPLLTPIELVQVQRTQMRRLAALFVAAGSVLVTLAWPYTTTQTTPPNAAGLFIGYAALLGVLAGLQERTVASSDCITLQTEAILRHSDELANAYGLPANTTAERRRSLTVLSIRLLSDSAGAPGATVGLRQDERRLAQIINQSVESAISPTPIINISGSMRLKRVITADGAVVIQFEMRSGETVYLGATESPEKSDSNLPFRLTGGTDADTTPVRINIDAPGQLVTPRRATDVIATNNGHLELKATIEGSDSRNAEVFVSAYCSNRFVGVCRLRGET